MQKNQKYALRITGLGYQSSISQRFPENFTENHQNILRFDSAESYQNWQNLNKQSKQTQLIRILNSNIEWIQEDICIEEFAILKPPWNQEIQVNIIQSSEKALIKY